MAKIVIIGAGLTGLSAAYHLEKKGFFDYTLFEKESEPGGLCRSVVQEGFTFDYTGHLLHINDPYFQSFIESLQDVYTRYPFQINLFGLPVETIADCIEGFVTRHKTRKKPHNFPTWVQQNFGSGFAKYFFLPYQKKIFAYNINKITAAWTGRFVPSTSLRHIIYGAFQDSYDPTIGYNAQFFYPKYGGIVSWVNKLAEHILNPIHTNFCVKSVNLKQKTIFFTNGHVEPFEQLITTMPLDTLLQCTQEKAASSLKRALPNLLCNSVVNFNLGIKKTDLSDKHWIYFPERQYPFYRLGFPHNFAKSMTPEGCSSLYGEFAHINKSRQWVSKTLQQALTTTKNLLHIGDQDISTQKIMHINHAYVIYDQWHAEHLPAVHKRLQEQSVYSVGRYGAWKYSSMQEAVLDGKKIAEQLIVLPAKQYVEAGVSYEKKDKKQIQKELT